jgi:uncharacterized protein involved in cysteine biosynthesis
MNTDSQFRHFIMSLRLYAGSFAFIRNNQLRHWYGIALVGTAATMLSVGKGLEAVSDSARMWLMDRVLLALDESSFGWLVEGLEVTVEGVLWLLTVWLGFKFTKFVVLVVLSPVFALASDAVANALKSEKVVWHGLDWKQSLVRGIRSAILLVLLEMGLSSLLFIGCIVLPFFVPILGFMTLLFPVLSAVLSIWFYGAASLDYAWEKHGYAASEGLHASWKLRGVTLGIGLPFYAAMTIPVLAIFTGPLFGGLLCVVAGLRIVASTQLKR